MLATYKYNENEKIVCACEDFTDKNNVLYEFESLALLKLNDVELKNLAINCYSCIKENGKKINYMTFMKKMSNEDCNDAIRRVVKKIKIDDIFNFIDNITEISNTRKRFYKKILEMRYEILKEIYNKIK